MPRRSLETELLIIQLCPSRETSRCFIATHPQPQERFSFIVIASCKKLTRLVKIPVIKRRWLFPEFSARKFSSSLSKRDENFPMPVARENRITCLCYYSAFLLGSLNNFVSTGQSRVGMNFWPRTFRILVESDPFRIIWWWGDFRLADVLQEWRGKWQFIQLTSENIPITPLTHTFETIFWLKPLLPLAEFDKPDVGFHLRVERTNIGRL